MKGARWEKKYAKFGNRKTVVDGMSFDSEREAVRYCELKVLEKAGEITSLERQVKFVLASSVKYSNAKRATPELRYFADFAYRDKDGNYIVEDAKGFKTDVYKIKRHLMLAVHGIEIREV